MPAATEGLDERRGLGQPQAGAIDGDQPMPHPAGAGKCRFGLAEEQAIDRHQGGILDLVTCLADRPLGCSEAAARQTIEQALQGLAHGTLEVEQQPGDYGSEGQCPLAGEVLRTLPVRGDEDGISEQLAQVSAEVGIELARTGS